jgi:hypothetical protein
MPTLPIRVARSPLILLVLLVLGCAGIQRVPTPPVVAADPGSVEVSLFLIGDAGAPAPDEPVLIALRNEIKANPSRSATVFLGDNIYPRGMPPEGSPMRTEAERRLKAQVDIATATETPAYFVLGNHDWAYMSPDGLASARRQSDFIDEHGAPWATLLPAPGCPGPAFVDIGPNVRVVLIDTHWWLHPFARHEGDDSPCAATSDLDIINQLNQTIIEAGERHVVVVAHHPLRTGGIHGGNLGWSSHVFPLRELADWLYVPLPVLGSAYALRRSQAGPNQDISGPLYERLRRALNVVFSRRRPLIYAAGHDHNLQVIEGDDDTARWLLVSGSGIYGHVTRVNWVEGTRYAAPASGYMRADFLRDGRVRLGVRVVDAEGGATERYSLYLIDEEDIEAAGASEDEGS